MYFFFSNAVTDWSLAILHFLRENGGRTVVSWKTVVFQQGPVTSPKAQISPVLLHRRLPFQYFGRKRWIWYFLLPRDVVLSQRGFTLEASSKPTHWSCHSLHNLAVSTSGKSIGWAIAFPLGPRALLPFLFFCVFLFSFFSPALTSLADSFRIRCLQLVPMLFSNHS